MVELSEIKRALQSSTLKHRREAVKQLELQLASPRFLRLLDINTVKLWPEDKIQLLSWPGLVDTYLSYMHKEVAEHKKQLDATALKVFKTIFTAADNTDRCGAGRNNLLRRAGAAFDKFGKMLEVFPEGEGLASALGKEIASVLLKVLLPNHVYCQRGTVEAFQGLLEEAMLRFEALQGQVDEAAAKAAEQAATATATGRLLPAGRGGAGGAPSAAAMQQELFTVANLLTGLLSGVPGQMAGAFVVDLLGFITQALAWLDKQGDYGRVSRQLMACLNGLLLTYGADMRPHLPTTHKALSSYIKHAWAAHTSVPVKDGVLCFCRLSLALGGVLAAGGGTSLQDLLSLVTRDINAPAFTWDLTSNKQHQQLAALAASLFYHAAFTAAAPTSSSASGTASGQPAATAAEVGSCGSTGEGLGGHARANGKRRASSADAARAAAAGGGASGDEGSSDDEVLQLPRKRSRVMGPGGQLLMHLQSDPERWGPVTALLLHQHGPLLPPSFVAALQQQLATSTAQILAALGSHAAAGSRSSQGVAGAGVLGRRSASPAVAAAGASVGAAGAGASGVQLQQQLLWLFRCLCELILCWPAALHTLAGSSGDSMDCGASAGAAAGAVAAAGPVYDPSEGACSHHPWPRAEVAAARAKCSSSWQQLWDGCGSRLAAGDPSAAAPALQDSMTWLLHMLVARRLVQLPSKAAALLKLQGVFLPRQQQGSGPASSSYDDEQPLQQQQQHVVLSEAQLALLVSLCLAQQVSSQKEMLLRQQLLLACLSTAEAWSSDSRRGRFSSSARAGSMGPPAPVVTAALSSVTGKSLPDLLLPAMLALLGAPGLPTPSLNGAPAAATMACAAASRLAKVQNSWGFVAGSAGSSPAARAMEAAAFRSHSSSGGGAETVWYTAAEVWWGADQQLEAQLSGLEAGLDTLRRQLAAEQLQQLLAAAAAADATSGSAAAGPTEAPADPELAPAAAAGEAAEQAAGEAAGSAAPEAVAGAVADAGWWKCWCQLADEAAEHLSNALVHFTAGRDEEHALGASQETVAGGAADGVGPAAAASDPIKQLSYLLLLLNVSISLPCIAALQFRQRQQHLQQLQEEQRRKQQQQWGAAEDVQAGPAQQQQQEGRPDMFCGFGFSRHPEQHQQLQKLVMEAGIKAGQLLADNLQQLPCQPGSTWLQQLMHLGASLARIQALMVSLPTQHGPDTSRVNYQLLAAASFLAEVVKALERATFQAAAAASAEPDEDMDAGGAAGDADFDDDFMIVAPAHGSRQGSYGASQQPAASMMGTPAASFRATQLGPTPAVGPAAAPSAGPGAVTSSGPAVMVGGGLAGFSGGCAAGLGNPSAVLSPALLAHPGSSSRGVGTAGSNCRPGFAVGGLGEGLSGLGGVEGAGLRVFAALSPAYTDTAQALMRLWKHMAGLTGWAPPDALLQAVVEAATTAVCAGGWSHLQQLFGLMKGSHTLLAAQKVPTSTSHLILRLLQQVAAAASAAGLQLGVPCALPESQASEEVAEPPSQEQPAGQHSSTYMSVMFDIFTDVQRRLGLKHDQPAVESQLAQSTQLQLGLTTLALLQLQPQASYAATAAAGSAAQHAQALATWRQRCLLGLLSSPSSVLRARAGPLAAAMLTSLSASVAAAASAAADAANNSISGAPSATVLVKAALADVSGYLFLQDSEQMMPAQAGRAQRRQAAMRAAEAGTPSAKAELDATNREAQQDMLAWEAAVVQLAQLAEATTAAACAALQQQEPPDVLDAQLVLLLVRHAASLQLLPDDALPSQPSTNTASSGSGPAPAGSRAHVLQLVGTALDLMSSQQQYSSRYAYLHYHQRSWAKEWVAAGCTMQQLLAVQPLICPAGDGASDTVLHLSGSPALEAVTATAAAAGSNAEGAGASGSSTQFLLRAYGSGLVYWLIYHGAQEELLALAAAAGLDEAGLLRAFAHELCSCVYPLLKVPELKQQESRFRRKLPNTAEDLSQEDIKALVFSIFETSLPLVPPSGHQQAELGLEATLPFITQTAANRALAMVAKLFRGTVWLSALAFTPAGVQSLLLSVHRSLAAAAHPLHKLQRMGQVQCLVRQLPKEWLQAPAVARSLVSMLTQHLQVPQLQGVCCGCLQQLLAELFAVVPNVRDEQGLTIEVLQFEAKKVTPNAKQQQQQEQQQLQQELVTALLQELLPPVVAALVQCVEAAVSGAQLQQKLHLWTGQPHAAAAAAAAGGSTPPLDLPGTWSPVSLLHHLFQSVWVKGLGVLLDLLPPLPVLAAAAQKQQWSSTRLHKLVPWFAGRAANMTASSRQRAVQYLLAKVRRRPDQLYGDKDRLWLEADVLPPVRGDVLLQDRAKKEIKHIKRLDKYSQLQVLYPNVAAASFSLARTGAELCDQHVMQLAAELLAVIGPMDPDVISIDQVTAADYSSYDTWSGNSSSRAASRGSSGHADRTAFPLRAVLQLLVGSLFDARPHVVSTAQQTLGALVAAVDGSTLQQVLQLPPAVDKLDGSDSQRAKRAEALLLQACVSTYVQSSPPGTSAAAAAAAAGTAAAALQQAASVELWSPVGKPYKQWLCSLSSCLLQACAGVRSTSPAPAGGRRAGRSSSAPASMSATPAVLALLADAAAIDQQLAELLLPHALLKLCESDNSGADVPGAGSQGWAARLGEAAAAGLKLDSLAGSAADAWRADSTSPWSSAAGDLAAGGSSAAAAGGVNVRCYSVLLACLEHNRSVHRIALMQMPCDPAPAAAAWHRCFCLHLDYLAVAAAAMAVEAYFTALLYVEQWCAELQQAGMNPFQGAVADSGIRQLQQLAGLGSSGGSSDGGLAGAVNGVGEVQQQQQGLLEQLLLDLYSHVNEPDGVYALVAAFGSPASQLQLLQHEQRWAAVLGGQDALLQAAVLQTHQQSGSSHVTGALTALQRLGCPATAQQCIAGALNQEQQHLQRLQQAQPWALLHTSAADHDRQQQLQEQQVQQLLEAQHELAWRLSDWGLADALNPGLQGFSSAAADAGAAALGTGGSPGSVQAGQQGFHAAVLAALTALQQRDAESFSAHVTGAQQACVLKFARSSTQSAAAVNPLLAQLQMLQMLTKGSNLARSSAGAAAGMSADWAPAATRQLLDDLLPYTANYEGDRLLAPAAAQKLSGISFKLSDQMLSLQAALTKALRRPDGLLATLLASMKVARQAGQVNFAAAALQQVQETLHQAVLGSRASGQGLPGGLVLPAAVAAGAGSAGAELPGWIRRAVAADAGWPLESVKIRWLQGQHQAALKELQGLAVGLQGQLAGIFAKGDHDQLMQLPGEARGLQLRARDSVAYALMEARMLLGKWLASGEGSTSDVHGAIQQLQSAILLPAQYEQHTGFSFNSPALESRAYYQLAVCADQQYQVVSSQLASPEFQKQQQVLQTKEQLLQQLTAAYEATRHFGKLPAGKQASAKQSFQAVARRHAETSRQVALDKQAVVQLQERRRQYLVAALDAYSACIAKGDKHDLQVVYRMCGLWFTHSDDEFVNDVMERTFATVPMAKFVPLVYQIASRMDNSGSRFQGVLTGVLLQMAQQHPFHCLYPLIALSNGDTEGGDPGTKTTHMRHETNIGRVAAASALLQQVAASSIPLSCVVDDMTAQVTDLIAMTLQVHKSLPKDSRNQLTVDQYTMPANFRRRLKSLRHAPPICYSLPLDPAGNYWDGYVPTVEEIDSTIKIAGGINSPLILKVTDSYGRVQRQLCKCNDDLRQDAVMQQFFGLVDTLLAGSPSSKQRRLGLRTYRVVPCSPLVGVLEWVEGTTPLTDYLLGDKSCNYSGGASGRYQRPGGLSWLDCYMKFTNTAPQDLKEAFLYCCKQFQPVLHNFFLEAFPHPSEWFEARTRYTRSTAVASMAGAVIGLGDRHMGNILLDMHTAEVVHIDLGIAFEQGLFLQTPERVPFRLTNNIVDGMGAAGVEGTFRRCCETALQVLRDHQDALLTVVQVVLHDPLYRWQMTPVKAGRKQLDPVAQQDANADGAADASDSAAGSGVRPSAAGAGASSGGLGNADAERAVLRVKQKLQGQDVEGGASLSVAAQVAAWMLAARDPDNLCRMFKGWAPWV